MLPQAVGRGSIGVDFTVPDVTVLLRRPVRPLCESVEGGRMSRRVGGSEVRKSELSKSALNFTYTARPRRLDASRPQVSIQPCRSYLAFASRPSATQGKKALNSTMATSILGKRHRDALDSSGKHIASTPSSKCVLTLAHSFAFHDPSPKASCSGISDPR
jgi:hypothetical protein